MTGKRTIEDIRKLKNQVMAVPNDLIKALPPADKLAFARLRVAITTLLYQVERGAKIFPRYVISLEQRKGFYFSKIYHRSAA